MSDDRIKALAEAEADSSALAGDVGVNRMLLDFYRQQKAQDRAKRMDARDAASKGRIVTRPTKRGSQRR